MPLVLSRPLAAEQGALKAREIEVEILPPSRRLLVCARYAMRCQRVLSTQGKHLPFGAAKEFYLRRFVELLLFWPRGVFKCRSERLSLVIAAPRCPYPTGHQSCRRKEAPALSAFYT